MKRYGWLKVNPIKQPILYFFNDYNLTHTHTFTDFKRIDIMLRTLKDDKYRKDLISKGFPENLFTSQQEYAEKLLNHCNKYDMVFLKGSYGTIVYNGFGKHFKRVGVNGNEHILPKGELADHMNILQSRKDKQMHIATSSPYTYLDEDLWGQIMEYPYNVYAINPKILDYIQFAYESYDDIRESLMFINYAFTDATPQQMMDLNNSIQLDTGIYAPFMPLKNIRQKNEG